MNINEPRGLLFSQVGYDLNKPKRIFLRGPKNWLSQNAKMQLLDEKENIVFEKNVKDIGTFWEINWWLVDFSEFNERGKYKINLVDDKKILLSDNNLTIDYDILFKKCAKFTGPECFKKRAIFARVKPGWFDAGYLWQEVCSHSIAIAGLVDLYKYKKDKLSETERNDILEQITGGCTYLLKCNDEAIKEGKAEGLLIHDIARLKDVITPNDSFMAALALTKAADILKKDRPEKAEEFANRAIKILNWIDKEAKPMSGEFNHPYNQGFEEGQKYPEEWMTRYLMLALWAEIILVDLKYSNNLERIDKLTEKILTRQISKEDAEFGLWGHFYAYDSIKISEKAWSHGMPPKFAGNSEHAFGADMGAVFTHPIFCFLEGIKRLPKNKNASKWKKSLEDFIFNYFKPACLSTPFKILPRGVFGKEGLLWFAGLWHGANTIYGQAAALAMEFYNLTNDKEFLDIAYSNLQWICGLNAGLTKRSMELGCVIFNTDLEDDIAYPVSMIKGIGNREAGNWTNIRGSICNGFGVGKQFRYDVLPKKKYDTPEALHDEDWITHNGGFLMGLARI